jgi:hypothetical protein
MPPWRVGPQDLLDSAAFAPRLTDDGHYPRYEGSEKEQAIHARELAVYEQHCRGDRHN